MTKRKLTPRQQVAEMKRIVNIDATGRGQIIDSDGDMCVLGGLAHYGANIRQSTMVRWERNSYGNDPSILAFSAAKRAFPILRKYVAKDIFKINDHNPNLKRRRAALCKFFDGLLT